MAVNQIERASRAWPILISIAKQRKTVTYGELAILLNIHHRAIRFVLSVIQDYCLEVRIPPITILVINGSGKPGSGFIAYNLDYFDEGLDEVFSFDWDKIENPFIFGVPYPQIIREIIHDPDNSEGIYHLVRSRGISQIIFRDALLKAYRRKCAFTEISFTESLEACHIVPWSQSLPAERLDIRNGILLNSFHHKLFDRGIITFSCDYKIIYCDPEEKNSPYSQFDTLLTTSLHGKNMHIPYKINNRPQEKFIKRHDEIVEWDKNYPEL